MIPLLSPVSARLIGQQPVMLRRMTEARSSARTLVAELRSGRLSARAGVSAALERAAETQSSLNAFTIVTTEAALAEADRIDARIASGEEVGPLAGVPVVVKDNLCVANLPTSAGSRSLLGFVPPYDATVVARLRAAGAVVVAKSNLDEFGIGSTNELSAFGPVRNPLDLERVAGGSSGGSAAAVAAGVAPLALASDTGGSTRLPASYCGIYGFKPSYGGLSRYGLVAHASSLDQVGLMATDLSDLRLLLEVLSGHDPKDPNSVDLLGFPDTDAAGRGLRVGVISELDGQLSSAASAAQGLAVEQLQAAGAEVVELSIPSVQHAVACYAVLVAVEAFSNLARYDGMLFGKRAQPDSAAGSAKGPPGQEQVMRTSRGELLGYGPKRRTLFGALLLSDGYRERYYQQALRLRAKLSREMHGALNSVDLIITPAANGVAPRLSEGPRLGEIPRLGVGPAEAANDQINSLANLSGLPAVSVPLPTRPGELPLGVQLIGPYRRDLELLQWAALLAPQGSPGG